MQRVSSSPRRSRLNSGDSHHSHRSVSSGGPRRSRSQERSLQEDDADDEDNDSNNYSNSNNNSSSYSQASTEQGSDDHELSDAQEIDQKLLRLEEQFDHTNLISCSSSKDEHVVISATSSNATATTTASNATTTTTATTSNKTHHVQHQHQHHHPSSSQRIYKRAASDRLDSSAVEEETSEEYCIVKDEKVLVVKTHKAHILPTLPRYPVAETRDLNCWSEPPVDIFRVRGYNYLKDHKKVHSEPYLLRARGCDLFLFPKHHNNDKQKSKSNREQQPITMMDRISSLLNGTLHKEPTLVFNFKFPWGLMILYYEIPKHLAKYLNHVPKQQQNQEDSNHNDNQTKPNLDNVSPGERAFANWIMGDDEYKNQRLKLIPIVVEGPWVVRNLVTGKPAIIGTKLPISYYKCHHNIMVAELDIGNSSATAKRIVSLCRRYMKSLTVDIGFVIQGNTQQELPEQMVGSIRIHGVDPIKAPTFS